MDEGDQETNDDEIKLKVFCDWLILPCERMVGFREVISRRLQMVSGCADEVIQS